MVKDRILNEGKIIFRQNFHFLTKKNNKIHYYLKNFLILISFCNRLRNRLHLNIFKNEKNNCIFMLALPNKSLIL